MSRPVFIKPDDFEIVNSCFEFSFVVPLAKNCIFIRRIYWQGKLETPWMFGNVILDNDMGCVLVLLERLHGFHMFLFSISFRSSRKTLLVLSIHILHSSFSLHTRVPIASLIILNMSFVTKKQFQRVSLKIGASVWLKKFKRYRGDDKSYVAR